MILVVVVRVLLFLALSCLAGGLNALVAAFILRNRESHRVLRITVAASLPPVLALYMLVCAAAFSLFSPARLGMLFGDTSEALPHGYVLTAPAGWPGFSRIEFTSAPDKPTISGYIRSLEVDGPLVLGAYNWRYDSRPDKDQANQGYFAFDTRNGRFLDFDTLAELNRHLGIRFISWKPSTSAVRTSHAGSS